MGKYSVAIPWHATVIVKVEAENEEDAAEKAMAESHPTLCWQCSSKVEMDSSNDDHEVDVEKIE